MTDAPEAAGSAEVDNLLSDQSRRGNLDEWISLAKALSAQVEVLAKAYVAERDALLEWKQRAADFQAELDAVKTWLDSNTTFYNVDADWPVDTHNVPVLAQVSARIWYHATDDQSSYPFSAVIDAARAAAGKVS